MGGRKNFYQTRQNSTLLGTLTLLHSFGARGSHTPNWAGRAKISHKSTSQHTLFYIECYIICLDCLFSTIFRSICLISAFIRNTLTGIAFLFLVNGISQILVTIVIRLLRVFHRLSEDWQVLEKCSINSDR